MTGAGVPLICASGCSWETSTAFPLGPGAEMVRPLLVLNFMLCTVVQCSMKLLRDSKDIVQLLQCLFVLSWMSDFGGFGRGCSEYSGV